MSYIILAILFLLSGFFMKYSDDLYDVNHDLKFACVFGVLCAIASASAFIYNIDAAYIFIAILIGNLLAFKIDGIHHIITLLVFVVICVIWGIPDLSLVVLLICILAAFSDEVGHELVSKFTNNRFLNLFFEYRFVMKIVILILAICGVFDIWIFLCFIAFEIAYETAGIVFEKFN
ncbi:hypothetical protein TL18_03980 [Methanobrevibacter sp. YE315]|uniref:hypothetical protein n=1 Tax=Methanobrevibacter sp. YE315 TaxID=1609968 RepID=UPI000764F0BB|nr:hypothetical protein [Methanobrevibacter sp. YE315]AMD17254.1 hypothetical protein TL18_03980 [Methanobrevibacter sp. YE315]